jgi:Haem-binding domain
MRWSRILVGLTVVLFAIQLVPVARTNPPVKSTVPAPPEVERILRRACFDCHSNETVWPPQAYVAPVSWLVAHDVKEGREELNFSEWSPEQRRKAAKKLAKEVEEGEMPPSLYVAAHPGAKLGKDDRALLTNWASGL